jgi:hypothetical protein
VVGAGTPSAGPATSTGTGTTTIVGSGTPSTSADTSSASGTVGGGSVTGAGATTLADDTGSASGTAGTPPAPDDGYSHSTGGRPLPRRRPQPPTPPVRTFALPAISGRVDIALQNATCTAHGEVDPFNLLAEDEELLLLV